MGYGALRHVVLGRDRVGYRRRVDRPAVALVGPGRWGRHILRDLVALGAETTVVDHAGRSREAALAAGAAAVVDSVDALPERVTGAVVATPTTTHAEVVEQLLERPLAVFCEKPLTDDPASAARIAAAAPDRVFVMHKWRYHPGVELLAELVRSEELGPVVGLRTTRIGWGNPHGDVDGIWMLASHDLSIALEVLGTIPEPRAAVAELVAQTATGLVGLLGDDPWFALEISTSSAVRRREVRLICRDGVATLGDAYADNVVLTTGRVDREPLRRVDEERPVSTELPLLRELRAFLEYLAGGPPPRSSAAEALADVEAIAGLRELAGLPRSSVVP